MAPSIWQILVVLLIVLIVFGKKLPSLTSLGKDLGGAFRGFKEGIKGEENSAAESRTAVDADPAKQLSEGQKAVEGEAKSSADT